MPTYNYRLNSQASELQAQVPATWWDEWSENLTAISMGFQYNEAIKDREGMARNRREYGHTLQWMRDQARVDGHVIHQAIAPKGRQAQYGRRYPTQIDLSIHYQPNDPRR